MYDSCVTASAPPGVHSRVTSVQSLSTFRCQVTTGNLNPLYLGLPDHTKCCRIDHEEMLSKFSCGRLILSLQKSLKSTSHSHSVCCRIATLSGADVPLKSWVRGNPGLSARYRKLDRFSSLRSSVDVLPLFRSVVTDSNSIVLSPVQSDDSETIQGKRTFRIQMGNSPSPIYMDSFSAD